jgi:hypothetical protein
MPSARRGGQDAQTAIQAVSKGSRAAPCFSADKTKLGAMVQPIIVQSGNYEARTDGSLLEVRRKNGVVVGEGRVGLFDGSFCVGEYKGEVDEDVNNAVRSLLRDHESDIVARWLVAKSAAAQA